MERSYNVKCLADLCADTALRLGLGAMFIYSAWGKIQDPGTFQTMVDNYRMLPECVTAIFSITMSMAEMLVGAMFIFTKWTREAAFATAVMLLMFIVALAQAQMRGLDISCGCFSEAEKEPHALLFALARDALLAVPTIWLMLKGQRRWIADFRRNGRRSFGIIQPNKGRGVGQTGETNDNIYRKRQAGHGRTCGEGGG